MTDPDPQLPQSDHANNKPELCLALSESDRKDPQSNFFQPRSGYTSNSSQSSSFCLSQSVIDDACPSTLPPQTGDSVYQPPALQDHPYRVISQLDMCGRCDEDACNDEECIQMKKLLSDIEDRWLPHRNTAKTETVMVCIYQHCKECTNTQCPYNWCFSQGWSGLQQTSESNNEKMAAEVCERLTQPLNQQIEQIEFHNADIVQYDINCPIGAMHLESQVWKRLCMMRTCGKAMLVSPHNDFQTEMDQYWVVKQVRDSQTWKIYYKLRELRNPNFVTPLLWSMKENRTRQHVYVGSALEGISLHEYLRSGTVIPLHLVVGIMLELTTILRHLHDISVIYLNWTGKNILVSQDEEGTPRVRLINFECSALLGDLDLDKTDLDLDKTKSALPMHLLPPEILEKSSISYASDVWGLGCLMYELVTERPVWHQHRHEEIKGLESIIREKRHPEVPEKFPILMPVFKKCWQVYPEKRASVSELEELLIQCRDSLTSEQK